MATKKVGDLVVHEAVLRCRELAKQLGGRVIVVDHFRKAKPTEVSCPFSTSLSIDWDAKIVYVSEAAKREDVSGLIHEMGHVFASRQPSNQSKEWPFFGWEYCAALKLGLLYQWDHGNANYSISSSISSRYRGDWGDQTPDQKDEIIRDRITYAIKAKMVSKQWEPLSIR